MSNTWEVLEWYYTSDIDFGYRQIYAGESAWKAIISAIKLKLKGVGYVKIEWR